MKTLTRRTALAVPVTLPLLPVSAYAGPYRTSKSDLPAEDDGDFLELVENLEKLPPNLQEAVKTLVRSLAEERRKRRGVAS